MLVFEKFILKRLFANYFKPKKLVYKKKPYTEAEKMKFIDFFKKKNTTQLKVTKINKNFFKKNIFKKSIIKF